MIKTNTETVRRILAEFPNLQNEKKTLEGNHEMTYREAIRALYPTLQRMKKRGFKFVGPVIVYSYLQGIGVINDHIESCSFR